MKLARNKVYVSDIPELLAEWDFEKNDIKPTEITKGSHRKVWWKCKEGHSYYAQVNNIANGKRCPVCAGRKVLVGFNDLETWCINNNSEHLIREYSKENKQQMSEFTMGTHKEVVWICEKGHHYKMKISDRTVSHFGCPICSNHRLLSGYNDFCTWSKNNLPILIKEYSVKNKVNMDQIMPNSTIKVIWECSMCGFEYQSSPNSRVNMRSGCPKCAKRLYSSFPEQAILYYILKQYPDAINGYKDIEHGITELDIYIPSLKIGIEYDGAHWHGNDESYKKHIKKYNACIAQNIRLIRVKEDVKNPLNDCDCCIECNYSHNRDCNSLNTAIEKLMIILGNKMDVNIQQDELLIKQQYYQLLESNSLEEQYPELSKEWDYDKNGDLLPSMVFKSSSDIVWWKCPKCGNEYKMRINTRVGLETGNCKKCRENHFSEQFRRNVLQYTIEGEFIAEYSSINEASRITGINNIIACCKHRLKSSGGYIWRYADEDNENE